ncbi:site-specific DNA-methyltransferase [Stomatobaculum longum]|uniref:site-specific DNA-methyltransferase n=1 Tax=Stomatobaculum longum TaxID=796942 RepID=UPI0028DD2A15|nr:site-specific DNA-methyltransferase [Stomatobaculum longum]
MEKMRMESIDMTAQNIDKIAALFPNCITETADENGRLKKAINFDVLRQMLSSDVIEGDESYEFTWVGKKAAIVEANKPIRKTLRPCPKESVNWDTTENLYIEGDNLEVLKLLQESYLRKVKMIYIDPPYNTGNDFVYRDDFAMSGEEYAEESGQLDEAGNRLFRNTDSNGRFHSDWCSMIYSRLMLARNLLTDDGLIFISIDDNEYAGLKEICDEIFGEQAFLATFVWKRRASSALDKSKCSSDHEYVLAYKMKNFTAFRGIDKDYKGYSNPDNDPRGPWTTGDLTVGMTGDMRPNQYYDLVDPKTGKIYKPNYNRVWSYIPESMAELISDNRIVFPEDTNKRPMKKRFLSELDSSTNPQSTWMDNVGMNTESTKMMYELFGKSFFSYTKPESLLRALILQATDEDSIVLDFFSGSATTAHSVIKQNELDGGHRKFIMVQLPENTGEGSEAGKSGFSTICDIGKERIRRAGKKIKEENPLTTADLDIGFRVFKLDESNMNDVYYSARDYTQGLLTMLESNIKPDRTDLDLLFGCLLEWGLPLSLPYSSEKMEGCTVHTYNGGDLIACFDENIPDSVIREIAKRQPLRAVFRDSSFNGSPAKINVGEIFKMLAPDTRVKVI